MSPSAKSAQEIFLTAIEQYEPDQWPGYLDEACVGDEPLRHAVQKLLRSHQELGTFHENVPAQTWSPIPEQVGTRIGPYKLLQQIGEGGMGVVYMAEQTEPVERRVALKIIKPGMDTRQMIARFEAERQALAMMDHPNIAKVLDAGATDSGRPYFVMELVKGVPITKYCDEKQLTPRERLELFVPVCQAVQHAHQKAIIHRDIKPSNVLIARYDGRPVPKVIDFGVAKAVEQRLTERTVITEFGQVVGTVEYMSPEQAELNQLDVDTRSDVYSLGVLLYELLTGETPFDRQRLRNAAFDELLRIIREEEPPRPSQKLSSSQSLPSIAANRHLEPKQLSTLVHGELDWIVMKALEKDRTRRYDTANKFAEDVQHYLCDEEVAACPPSAAYKFRKLARKHKATISTAMAIAAALVIGTGVATWQAIRAAQERDRAFVAEMTAETEAKKAQDEAARALVAEAVAHEEAENAEQQRRQARRQQYHAEIVAGQTELANQNLGGLYTRLINYLPLDEEEDHRGWEWYYLMSHCRKEERLLVHRGRSPFAAWSPDGQLIGAPSAIWQADTGEQIRRFHTSHVARVRVAWSPDASKFAWCMTMDENAFYVWDRSTDQVTRFSGHEHSVCVVAWSSDGSQLASSSHDGTIKIWDAATGDVLWTSTNLRNAAFSLDWSPDGKQLAAGMHFQGVKVWNTEQWDLDYEDLQREIETHQVSWHPEGKWLAVCNRDSWYVLDRSDWNMKHQHSLLRGGHAIDYSPDGSKIAIGDGEAVVVWTSDGRTKVAELNGHLGPVISISWAPDGHRLVTAQSGGDIKLWDLDHVVDKAPIASGGPLQSLTWLDDQRTLITVSQEDGSSSWWDSENGSLEKSEKPQVPVPFELSPDRRLAAAREKDQPALIIFNAASGSEQDTLQLPPERTLQSFAFSFDGKRVASQSFAEKRSYLDFWKLDQPQPVGTWEWHRPYRGSWTDYRFFKWEPQGNRLATIGKGDVGDNGSIIHQDHLHIFDADTGKRLIKWNPAGRGKMTCLAWSHDRRYLAMGTDEGRLEIIDLETQRQQFSKKLHRHGITSLAWHPRGNRLACGTKDRSIKIISSADAGLLLNLPVPDGPPMQLVWNSEGHSLAAATPSGQIHTWSTKRAYEITPDGQRRSELAWAYYDRAERSSGRVNQAALRTFLQYAPDSLAYWETRGSALARLGKFEEAAQEYSKGIEPNIHLAFGAACARAYALLAAGKLGEYRDACTQLVEGFEDSPVPSVHEDIAWLCVLSPNQDVDWRQSLDLEGAGLRRQGGAGPHEEVLCRSAIWFREGKYEDTVSVASKLIDRLQRGGGAVERYYLACCQYYLAMTLKMIDEPLKATVMLVEANDQARYVKESNVSWQGNVVLDTLRREAEALINNRAGEESDQKETQVTEELTTN